MWHDACVSFVRFFLLAGSALIAWAAGGWLLAHPAVSGSEVNQRFGLLDTGIVAASAPDLFAPASAKALQAFNARMEKSEQCRAVTSLVTVPVITNNEDTTELTPLFDTPNPGAHALADPILVHGLVDPEGRTTLLFCPLKEDWPSFVRWFQADKHLEDKSLELTLTGPLGVSYLLARDLMLTGAFILLVALPLMFILGFFEKRYGRQFGVWGALAFIPLIAVACVGGFRAVRNAASPLELVLGGRAGRALNAVNTVTAADMTLLVDVSGDFAHAAPLRTLAGLCSDLAPANVGCPTTALSQAATALTGSAELPANDEQLKALMFLIGDRPDLGLVLSRDHGHALMRVQGADPAQIKAAADKRGLHAEISGLPLINQQVRRMIPWVLSIIGLGCAIAVAVGRKTGWGSATLGGGWVAASIVTPVGVAALALLTLGAFTVFASLGKTGITPKDIE